MKVGFRYSSFYNQTKMHAVSTFKGLKQEAYEEIS